MLGRPEPIITGIGPINRDTIDRYRTMAVMPFVDAATAQGSGSGCRDHDDLTPGTAFRAAVAHSLRRIHDAEVVLYSSWAGDPRAGFGEAIDVAAGIESDGTLVERLQAASQVVDGDVYVILDQFEEYFLYHEGDPFAAELAAAIREPGLRAHFLVGLREDALAKLDAFKGQIPNLFANYLRLDHLDRNGARAAILGPIERYNELTGEEVSVEPELVEALLDQVAAGRVDVGRAGRGGVETDEERIEAPYLQLVLERLWELERESGSNVLRLATLGELGGSESIVRAHLERALGRLQPAEQDVAATMFDHLVTPSGTKIAHRPSDLAQYAAVRENEVMPVLTVLGRERIVRAVDGAGGSERYEIFHDVLADGVLAWRDHYQAQRELDLTRREAARRHRQLLLVVGASLVALAAMATVTIFALTQRSEARSQRHHARAATLISTALAQLGVDPQESLRLARAAAGLDQSPVVETVLRQALLQSRLRLVLPAGGRVTSASFDPAGTRVLTASTNGDARLFDARSGQLLRVLRSRGPVSAAVFSRDGRFVATASADRRVRLWDAASGRPLHVFRQAGAVTGVSFDRSGSLLMSTSANRAQIWKVPSGTPVQTIRQDGPVLGASFSPDGTRVLTRGRKGAGLYDVSSGRLIYALPQRGLMTAAAFSPNGWFIATGGTDHRVRLWYARTGRLRYDLKEQGQVTDVAFGPSSALLATANSNGASHIWNVASGTLVAPAVGQRLAITDASFSPDGKWIVTASRDRTAGIYGVRNGLLINLLRGHLDTVNTASYSPNGNLVVTASDDGTARVWDPGSELQLRLLGHQRGPVPSAAFSPDGTRAVSASADGTAAVWRVRDHHGLGLLPHQGPVTSATFSPDGRSILTTSLDGTARLWRGGKSLVFRQGGPVTTGSFSPDGKLVVTAGQHGVVHVWRAGNGSTVWVAGHGAPVRAIVFSRNGKLVVSAGDDGKARLWKASDGSLVRVLSRHTAPIIAASFSPDDRQVLTASLDKTAIIWDASSGRIVHVLRGHTRPLTSASFSRDGKLVVTSSRDFDARTWSVATGKTLHVLRGHAGPVSDASFSPDGRWVVTAGPISAGLWPTATGTLLFYLLRHRTPLLTTALFSPDGRRILTAGTDGDTRLYSCRVCPALGGLVPEAERRLEAPVAHLTPAQRRRYGVG